MSDQQNGKSPFLPRSPMDNEENKNNTNKFRRTNINSLCSFNFNRFHYCVLLCWLFGIFFATQMIFSVFSNYIPKWKCLSNNTSNFARNCTIYQQCPENLIQFEENIPFHSAAMEFGWICGANAYNRALFRELPVLIPKSSKSLLTFHLLGRRIKQLKRHDHSLDQK
uniref:Uncharacterized protein n=1 Tax=Meloidogyne enterolobii TaxID=390850 RepID=A0A6V7X4I7_MELEN|nr:unnamed protein product [Meloidogyne enterolobii]